MKNNNTIKWRVSQLEANYTNLAGMIDTIRTNDLPHIKSAITSMKTRITVATTINIGVLILVVIITRLFN